MGCGQSKEKKALAAADKNNTSTNASAPAPAPSRPRSRSASFIHCEVASPVPVTRPPPVGSGEASMGMSENPLMPSSVPRTRPPPTPSAAAAEPSVRVPTSRPPSRPPQDDSAEKESAIPPALRDSKPSTPRASATRRQVGEGDGGEGATYPITQDNLQQHGEHSKNSSRRSSRANSRSATPTRRDGRSVPTPQPNAGAHPHPQSTPGGAAHTYAYAPAGSKNDSGVVVARQQSSDGSEEQRGRNIAVGMNESNASSRRNSFGPNSAPTKGAASLPPPLLVMPVIGARGSSPSSAAHHSVTARTPDRMSHQPSRAHSPATANTNTVGNVAPSPNQQRGEGNGSASSPSAEEHRRLMAELEATRRALDSVREENFRLRSSVSAPPPMPSPRGGANHSNDAESIGNTSHIPRSSGAPPTPSGGGGVGGAADNSVASTFYNAREGDDTSRGRNAYRDAERAAAPPQSMASSTWASAPALNEVMHNEIAFPNSAAREGRGLYGDVFPDPYAPAHTTTNNTFSNAQRDADGRSPRAHPSPYRSYNNPQATPRSGGAAPFGGGETDGREPYGAADSSAAFVNARDQQHFQSGDNSIPIAIYATQQQQQQDTSHAYAPPSRYQSSTRGTTPILHAHYSPPPARYGMSPRNHSAYSHNHNNSSSAAAAAAVLSSRRHSTSDIVVLDNNAPPHTSYGRPPTPRSRSGAAMAQHNGGMPHFVRPSAYARGGAGAGGSSVATSHGPLQAVSRRAAEERRALPDGDVRCVGSWAWWHSGGFDGAAMVSNAPEAVEKLRAIRPSLEDQMVDDLSPATLDVSHCAIHIEGCYSLCTLLASPYVGLHMAAVTSLDFSNNPIGDEGVGVLLQALARQSEARGAPAMPSVKALSFSSCGVASARGTSHIANHLFYQRTPGSASGGLFPQLEVLDVGYNALTPDAFRVLSEALVSRRGASNTLTVVDFTECHLAPLSYVYVQDALKSLAAINGGTDYSAYGEGWGNGNNGAPRHEMADSEAVRQFHADHLLPLPLRKIILAGHRFGYDADTRLRREAPRHVVLEMSDAPLATDANAYAYEEEEGGGSPSQVRYRRDRRSSRDASHARRSAASDDASYYEAVRGRSPSSSSRRQRGSSRDREADRDRDKDRERRQRSAYSERERERRREERRAEKDSRRATPRARPEDAYPEGPAYFYKREDDTVLSSPDTKSAPGSFEKAPRVPRAPSSTNRR